ncbi:MAG: histidine phosphatase family protein, partial [Anaerolineae bacterium]|nr:histidine phosphatase family protein [Anaerolineae bacterium]
MDRLREVETVFDLVRHAHANWSPDEMRPLSSAGAREARRVSWLLRQRREATVPPISLVISSPSLRARQTVAPLAAHLDLPLTIEIDLRERALGQDLGDVAAFRAAVRATWEDASFSLPGGETNSAAQARGVAVLEACHLNHGGEHIVLGTHGN